MAPQNFSYASELISGCGGVMERPIGEAMKILCGPVAYHTGANKDLDGVVSTENHTANFRTPSKTKWRLGTRGYGLSLGPLRQAGFRHRRRENTTRYAHWVLAQKSADSGPPERSPGLQVRVPDDTRYSGVHVFRKQRKGTRGDSAMGSSHLCP